MALKISYVLPSGLVAPDAYHKINALTLTKDELIANVRVFANAEARDLDNPSIAEISFMLKHADNVSLAYAYEQLKLFPDYANTEDC